MDGWIDRGTCFLDGKKDVVYRRGQQLGSVLSVLFIRRQCFTGAVERPVGFHYVLFASFKLS